MLWQEIKDEPSTAQQRRALYRLGLSRYFVHSHVKTKDQAQELISKLIAVNHELRQAEAHITQGPEYLYNL